MPSDEPARIERRPAVALVEAGDDEEQQGERHRDPEERAIERFDVVVLFDPGADQRRVLPAHQREYHRDAADDQADVQPASAPVDPAGGQEQRGEQQGAAHAAQDQESEPTPLGVSSRVTASQRVP